MEIFFQTIFSCTEVWCTGFVASIWYNLITRESLFGNLTNIFSDIFLRLVVVSSCKHVLLTSDGKDNVNSLKFISTLYSSCSQLSLKITLIDAIGRIKKFS